MTLSLAGEDLESLLFHFLDEFLFTFSADPFFIPKVCVFVTLYPLYCSTVDNHISLSHHSYYSESKNHWIQQRDIRHQSRRVTFNIEFSFIVFVLITNHWFQLWGNFWSKETSSGKSIFTIHFVPPSKLSTYTHCHLMCRVQRSRQ